MILQTLREFINEMLLIEKSFSRNDWKNNLESFFLGAIREFYKARLAKKNNFAVQQDIDQWMQEVDTHLEKANDVFNHTTRGFRDKERAWLEVRKIMNDIDDNRRKNATAKIKKYYAKKLDASFKQLDDDDTQAFWNLVDEYVGR